MKWKNISASAPFRWTRPKCPVSIVDDSEVLRLPVDYPRPMEFIFALPSDFLKYLNVEETSERSRDDLEAPVGEESEVCQRLIDSLELTVGRA